MSVATEETEPEAVGGPPIPLGRRVELPGRGTTFVREVAGPPGAPVVLLLHGLIASGGLNWFQAFAPLSKDFRVLAIDHRGHGRGLRSWKRFRLADCADDAAALLDVLGIDQAILVGYSMGGPIAQLIWHRHPEKVAGLVFCATSNRFVPGVRERLAFVTAVSAIAGSTRAGQFVTRVPLKPLQKRIPKAVRARPDSLRRWASAEMRRHDARMVTEALAATSNFDSRRWLHQVDVPTAIMVTTGDHAVPPQEQLRLLLAIPQASVEQFDEGHTWCAKASFGPAVAAACRTVANG
ncbi:alpha/beta hydrolase [Aquihabitans sp. G128]|uniref:alpha/beta fold hydrolase n=1 Tax=Aquihabitans sp. G128 TaxID=2849779 RepID=UPI001C22DDF1|nr:alpha/beta hydrolase [Aquihabitans sp. G128]QXC62934.1 alpha/beta hydrolase [Aquihabitans sp. G128]